MKYRFVIFDFDGTLANTFPWFSSVLNKLADRNIEESEYNIIRDNDVNNLFKYLDMPLWKISLLENQLRTLMAEDINQIPLFEGVETLLKCLSHNGITLAIVSSNSYENVRQILGPENAAFIKYYECDVSTFDKEIKLKNVLQQSGFLKNDSIYIGDEIRDSEAAKKANIAFGGVSWGFNSPKSLKAQSPQEMFTNINEILQTILDK